MIKRKGNLFDTSLTHIGHGVNTKGVMGAGIAKEFRDRFPENYRVYKEWCDKKLFDPGETIAYLDVDQTNVKTYWVHNIASQDKPGANARYDWLESALWRSVEIVVEKGETSIAIPLIGCGIGGLEWSRVEDILFTIEESVPYFDFEVWKYE